MAACRSPPAPGGLAGIFAHRGGEPVFEVGIEPVLRLARLQVEKAEDQRAGEAEQRGRKRNAHAAERRGEAFLQGVEQRAGVAADLQPVDHLADRADGFDQAPEGAEQPEEHQQAGHVAGNVAGLVEPGGDRIQQMPHGLLRDRHPPGALAAEDRRHRRQQRRVPLDREAGIGDAEIVDPGDLRIEPDHLAERQDGADQQHQPDQRVEAGIGEERQRRSACRAPPSPARTAPGTPASAPGKSGARTVWSVRSPSRSGKRGLKALAVSPVAREALSGTNMAQRGREKRAVAPASWQEQGTSA